MRTTPEIYSPPIRGKDCEVAEMVGQDSATHSGAEHIQSGGFHHSCAPVLRFQKQTHFRHRSESPSTLELLAM